MDADEAAILEANDAFYSAFANRDAAAMADLWAREAPVACTHPAWTVLTGRADVIKSWQGILGNPDAPTIEARNAVVQRHGDVALVLCREIVQGSPMEATNVFVREDGTWRMTHHHASAIARFLTARLEGGADPLADRRN
jgi:ketosteroid isomerase-like protein